jgi:ABC-type transporter Mla subunit MlaD
LVHDELEFVRQVVEQLVATYGEFVKETALNAIQTAEDEMAFLLALLTETLDTGHGIVDGLVAEAAETIAGLGPLLNDTIADVEDLVGQEVLDDVHQMIDDAIVTVAEALDDAVVLAEQVIALAQALAQQVVAFVTQELAETIATLNEVLADTIENLNPVIEAINDFINGLPAPIMDLIEHEVDNIEQTIAGVRALLDEAQAFAQSLPETVQGVGDWALDTVDQEKERVLNNVETITDALPG